MFWLEVQASVESIQFQVLSVAAFIVKPPPVAPASEVFPVASSIFLSATVIVVLETVVVPPVTTRSPNIVVLLFASTFIALPPFVAIDNSFAALL